MLSMLHSVASMFINAGTCDIAFTHPKLVWLDSVEHVVTVPEETVTAGVLSTDTCNLFKLFWAHPSHEILDIPSSIPLRVSSVPFNGEYDIPYMVMKYVQFQ